MAESLQPPRGTADLLGDEGVRVEKVERVVTEMARVAGFKRVRPPVFERSALFKRGLGESSDVVSKEMYEFTDRGGESLTLRPEFTAGTVRAFINAGLHHDKPARLYSFGPLFRYERPQKGRRRQFHQGNFEIFGPSSPLTDSELINTTYRMLERLGVASALRVEINSLGDAESRNGYREALKAYLSKYESDLSEDSKRRLQINPLRILDSKDNGDKHICADAPPAERYRTPEATRFFERVQEGLTALQVPFVVNPTLVRGLDYYCHTAFECVSEDPEIGAQSTVAAGGRYDGLVAQLGGEPTPASGFAIGAERVARLLPETPAVRTGVVLFSAEEKAELLCLRLCHVLRAGGVACEYLAEGTLRKRYKIADKKAFKYSVTIGGDELARGHAIARDLASGTERDISLEMERYTTQELRALFS